MREKSLGVGKWVLRNGLPYLITEVVTAYRLDGWAAVFSADELTPYEPPLRVGDAVRKKDDHIGGGIVRCIEGQQVCYLSKHKGCGLYVRHIDDLERDPDAGKAVGT